MQCKPCDLLSAPKHSVTMAVVIKSKKHNKEREGMSMVTTDHGSVRRCPPTGLLTLLSLPCVLSLLCPLALPWTPADAPDHPGVGGKHGCEAGVCSKAVAFTSDRRMSPGNLDNKTQASSRTLQYSPGPSVEGCARLYKVDQSLIPRCTWHTPNVAPAHIFHGWHVVNT